MRAAILILSFGVSLVGLNACAAGNMDKARYSLLNPTPVSLLREFSTDRPDFTESPFTVDAGHYQLEMDFARYTRATRDHEHERTGEITPANLRVGVLNNVELGVFLSPYKQRVTTPASRAKERASGFGDVTLRSKINFSGNDGGDGELATGIIADVTLPTAAADIGAEKTEYGLTLPIDFDLPSEWHGGAMTRIEFLGDPAGGYQRVWSNSLTLGHDLTKNLSGYLEIGVQTGVGTAVTFLSFGAAWKLSVTTQLDAGAVVGLSRAADDLQLFSGLSRRF